MKKTPSVCSLGVLAFLLMTLAGCTSTLEPPDLGAIYNRAARYHGLDRNPVIVIPGILGSRLVDNDGVVWGAFGGGAANPERPEGARRVAHPMGNKPLRQLKDGVVSDGALDRLRLKFFGLPISLNAYAEILGALGAGGYRDEGLGIAGAIDYGTDHFTCFQFAYDWRRDNIENARLLHEFILDKKKFVEGKLKELNPNSDPNVRFDIIAHSMGGLVTRWYMRYGAADLPARGLPKVTWAGCEFVERAVLIGTPNAGSADALLQLVNGIEFSRILPEYRPAVLATMPSIYQLMHRPRHQPEGSRIDVYDVAVWEKNGWGLFDPNDAEVLKWLLPKQTDGDARRGTARAHVTKCLDRTRRFHQALDHPARPPEGTSLSLFAGDAVATVHALDFTNGKVTIKDSAPGDGSVLRTSALMDEREDGKWVPHLRSPIHWHRVHFLFEDHLGLTKSPVFTDNVLYLLLEEPR